MNNFGILVFFWCVCLNHMCFSQQIHKNHTLNLPNEYLVNAFQDEFLNLFQLVQFLAVSEGFKNVCSWDSVSRFSWFSSINLDFPNNSSIFLSFSSRLVSIKFTFFYLAPQLWNPFCKLSVPWIENVPTYSQVAVISNAESHLRLISHQ